MTASHRTSSLVAGLSLALMTLLAPVGLLIALPAGATEVTALVVLVIATLDVIAAVALYPLLASGGQLLAKIATALRVAYGAIFAAAAGSLLAPVDVAHFQAVWDAALLLFGVHLVLVGVAMMRSRALPTWIGALVIVAGLGYFADSVLVALTPETALSFAAFTFIGELVLMVWLIVWGGRADRHQTPEMDAPQDAYRGAARVDS